MANPIRKRWIKFWTQEALYGPQSKELTLEEQAIWFKFKALAGDSPVPGVVCVAPGVPYTDEQLARTIGASVGLLSVAKSKMEQLHIINQDANGIHMTDWEKEQTSRAEYMREYMRKRRGEEGGKQISNKANSKHVIKQANSKHVIKQAKDKPTEQRKRKRGEEESNISFLSEKRRKQVSPDPRIKQILDTISEKVGYQIPNYAKEGMAVKRAFKMGFSLEQFMACWDKMKTFEFWRGKWLPLAKVTENLGEFVAGRLEESKRGPPKVKRLSTEEEIQKSIEEAKR